MHPTDSIAPGSLSQAAEGWLILRVCDSMNQTYPVPSTSPVAPYIGGKRGLAKTLVERINATPHNGFAEPFVGMGGELFILVTACGRICMARKKARPRT